VLCLKEDDIINLIVACDCYKKSDSNRVHRRCLEHKFADHQQDEPLNCPRCRAPYRLSIQYKFVFDWGRFLSARALGHCLEFFIVLFMIITCTITVTVVHRKSKSDETASWIIYVLIAITFVLVPLTLHRVYQRWHKANAAPQIVDLV